MKVIKRGKVKPAWPKKTKCRSCKSVIEVQEKDTTDARDRPSEPYCGTMARCPVCGDTLYFK